MKKTLIALAVFGTVIGVAHAQSNVSLYGVMDTGYVYQSGNSWRMGQNQGSKIGFRGTEDLGNDLKATFELERRFDLGDGTRTNTNAATYRGINLRGTKDWDGPANIGLAGNWGRVRFGRVAELSTETLAKFNLFYLYGVGSMLWSSQRAGVLDSTLRYDSPKWAGFNFGLSYSLGKNTKQNGELPHGLKNVGTNEKDISNDGYGINLSYDNYGWVGTANWSRLSDSDKSSSWNVGVGYKFGKAKVTLLYERTLDKGFKNGKYSTNWNADSTIADYTLTAGWKSEQKNWLLGLEWDIGPGQLDASIQYGKLKDLKSTKLDGVNYVLPENPSKGWDSKAFKDADIMKYAIGYTYNLSKRTSLYSQVSYTDFDNETAGLYYTAQENRDDAWGFQVGITHKF